MEWNVECYPFLIPLGGLQMGILPGAPSYMVETVEQLNKDQEKYCGWKGYILFNPQKQDFLQLVNPIPIIGEKDHVYLTELPTADDEDDTPVLRPFMKYSVKVANGKIIAIMEFMLEEMNRCNEKQEPYHFKYQPSCLGVSGKYEEKSND